MQKFTIDQIAARLGEITSDFHLGFGAFNEKPIRPFTVRRREESGEQGVFIESTDYSYRHVVSLTNNITKFRVS